MRDGCPFCDYEGPSVVQVDVPMPRGNVFVIAPVDPVVPGHVLVVPRVHVEHFAEDPYVSGEVMQVAAAYMLGSLVSLEEGWNVITSIGEAATQTVRHLHVHLVPRRAGDGLKLPWSPAHENVGAGLDQWSRP